MPLAVIHSATSNFWTILQPGLCRQYKNGARRREYYNKKMFKHHSATTGKHTSNYCNKESNSQLAPESCMILIITTVLVKVGNTKGLLEKEQVTVTALYMNVNP